MGSDFWKEIVSALYICKCLSNAFSGWRVWPYHRNAKLKQVGDGLLVELCKAILIHKIPGTTGNSHFSPVYRIFLDILLKKVHAWLLRKKQTYFIQSCISRIALSLKLASCRMPQKMGFQDHQCRNVVLCFELDRASGQIPKILIVYCTQRLVQPENGGSIIHWRAVDAAPTGASGQQYLTGRRGDTGSRIPGSEESRDWDPQGETQNQRGSHKEGHHHEVDEPSQQQRPRSSLGIFLFSFLILHKRKNVQKQKAQWIHKMPAVKCFELSEKSCWTVGNQKEENSWSSAQVYRRRAVTAGSGGGEGMIPHGFASTGKHTFYLPVVNEKWVSYSM